MKVLAPGICLVVAGLGLVGCGANDTAAKSRKQAPAVPVTVAAVVQKTVPIDIQVIGNVEAYSTIGVKSQVGGELTRVFFQEGDYVKKGDRLFVVDPRIFQAQVSQMEANLARDEAQLSQAQANLARDIAQEKYAQELAARYARLFQDGVISRDQTEQVRSDADAKAEAVKADRAAIESARAAIAADKALLENQRVQLGYTAIQSPIDGRTGNLNVKQGNIVKANDIDLLTINQIEPIYVTFSVPEAQLSGIKQHMAVGKLAVMAYLPDIAQPETGVLTFVDNSVDMSTGTIKLKGTFSNADRKLWPGQFVRVVLRLTSRPNALVVPSQAVQTGQEGQFVFVVKKDMTVESRTITPGPRIDEETVVEKGLESGETVVTEGHLRLAPGMKVQFKGGRGKGA